MTLIGLAVLAAGLALHSSRANGSPPRPEQYGAGDRGDARGDGADLQEHGDANRRTDLCGSAEEARDRAAVVLLHRQVPSVVAATDAAPSP